jgi:hypothetical protein
VQLCDQVVYPSIRLKEEIVVHPATIGESKLQRASVQTASVLSQTASPTLINLPLWPTWRDVAALSLD